MDKNDIKVAIFNAEYSIKGLTYNGGLGILSGDLLRSFADLNLPVVGVGIHYSKGNFHQELTQDGWQTEVYRYENLDLETNNARVGVPLKGGNVIVNSKHFKVNSSVPGEETNFVPLELVYDKGSEICDILYPGGSQREKRLKQEAILGIGGVEMLNALGYNNVRVYHLNEGHTALAALVADGDIIYTTHTPVPAGIDNYEKGLAEGVLLESMLRRAYKISGDDGRLHMMKLAMGAAKYSVGVSRLHQLVSKCLFYDFPSMGKLGYVDNGVHLPTWTAKEIQDIFDRETKGEWRKDPKVLEDKIIGLQPEEVWSVHDISRQRLARFLKEDKRVRGNSEYDPNKLTIGFARRFATYKQPDMLFDYLEELHELSDQVQIVYAGKAHPEDNGGKDLIKRIVALINNQNVKLKIWFIEDYDTEIAKLMVQGVDLWLNNPRRLEEAAGTSGMKSAANFVPQISIIDGWWLTQDAPEGYKFPKGLVEGVTGWGIGREPSATDFLLLQDTEEARKKRARDRESDSEELRYKLKEMIVPTFKDKKEWAKVCRSANAYNSPYFNTHRVARQYFEKYGIGIN